MIHDLGQLGALLAFVFVALAIVVAVGWLFTKAVNPQSNANLPSILNNHGVSDDEKGGAGDAKRK